VNTQLHPRPGVGSSPHSRRPISNAGPLIFSLPRRLNHLTSHIPTRDLFPQVHSSVHDGTYLPSCLCFHFPLMPFPFLFDLFTILLPFSHLSFSTLLHHPPSHFVQSCILVPHPFCLSPSKPYPISFTVLPKPTASRVEKLIGNLRLTWVGASLDLLA
jgi:hypothetical protein